MYRIEHRTYNIQQQQRICDDFKMNLLCKAHCLLFNHQSRIEIQISSMCTVVYYVLLTSDIEIGDFLLIKYSNKC